ncbi:Dopamine receptor 4 [Fasciolopsis buskii]|uniref:Dopamine receptor 4 n=1 Tax=Fasciolopsis buskii TaxID=27845 RepID=A0A8E0VMJ6_9TREM|nr:Dopamine receptor 4 [Fasciolopsis buski]
MCAIFVKTKLRQNVTNSFIASLAAADLLLGTVVMPFAIIEFHNSAEMSYLTDDQRKYHVPWPYGQDWCDLWHAFDVLSSTASILNLCVISVERYIAISDPFNYHTRMTHSRALIMIALAWVLSAFISFPAIVWWRYYNVNKDNAFHGNGTEVDVTSECTFPEDQLYLFLSSCVSFHIPLVVMVFVYWKIYQTATRVMESLKRGTTVVGGKSNGERVVLRVHRGCGIQKSHSSCQMLTPSTNSGAACLSDLSTRNNDSTGDSDASSPGALETVQPFNQEQEGGEIKATLSPTIKRHVRFARIPKSRRSKPPGIRCCSFYLNRNRSLVNDHSASDDSSAEQADAEPYVAAQSDKKKRLYHLKKRLKRFSQEKRAAKTLGVIMGTFICCWLPFFIYNTIKSIKPSFIRQHDYIIFPLFTWLGFMNSSINPFIYAFSLRDIRRAFHESLRAFCFQKRR